MFGSMHRTSNWTREQVKHYIAVLNTIGTEVLNLARGHQEGHVPENGTTVPTTTFLEALEGDLRAFYYVLYLNYGQGN